MRIYLVAGDKSQALKRALENEGSIEVARIDDAFEEALLFLKRNSFDFDSVLLTDQGIEGSHEDFADALNRFIELIDTSLSSVTFKFITKEPYYHQVFNDMVSGDSRFEIYFVDNIRIPVSYIHEICLKNQSSKAEETQVLPKKLTQSISEKALPILGRFRPFSSRSNEPKSDGKNKGQADLNASNKKQSNQKNSLLSNDYRKVIIVTGCRGAGVTSTAANLAVESSAQGLSTIVVDLDTEYRGINLYFSKFGDEVEFNPDLAYSLIRCIIKPDSYDINSCRINDNLFVSTLAYSISSSDKMLDNIDLRRLSALISFLRLRFNVVLIDMPIKTLKNYPQLLTQIDSIALCINNNLYSVISTVKTVEECFSNEDLVLFNVKSRAVITKFNEANRHQGKPFTPELTCRIVSDVGRYNGELSLAGFVPYSGEFDLQIDSGKKIASIDKSYKNYYFNILKNLL